MLVEKLLSFLLFGAEWVLWLLLALSVLSIAVVLERVWFFATHRLAESEAAGRHIMKGELDAARKLIEGKDGLEVAVIREGLANIAGGPAVVEEVLAATLSRERKRYERGLAILGSLGSNSPYIGLFGTVIGIIRSFHDLGLAQSGNAAKAAAGASAVMNGISEALVSTAVGLFVAIPAVIFFNVFNRWLKVQSSSGAELGHAIAAYLKGGGGGGAAEKKAA